jgi:hypothetical protein
MIISKDKLLPGQILETVFRAVYGGQLNINNIASKDLLSRGTVPFNTREALLTLPVLDKGCFSIGSRISPKLMIANFIYRTVCH